MGEIDSLAQVDAELTEPRLRPVRRAFFPRTLNPESIP